MTSSELERAIRIYLGADSSGAVYPVGMEERLSAEYGGRAARVLVEVRKVMAILDEYEADWSIETLPSAGRKVEESLAQRLPHLPGVLHRAMANYWCYRWK